MNETKDADTLGAAVREIAPGGPPPRAAVGAIVGLATLITMFAGLLFSYAYLRLAPGSGWPGGTELRLPRLWPFLASCVAVIGSSILWRVRSRVLVALLATSGGVILFEVLTLRAAVQAGLSPSSGPRGSVVFALTGLHAFHMSLFALIAAWCLRRGVPSSAPSHDHENGLPPASPAWAWAAHVLGALWIVIHVTVYVL